MSRTRSPTSSEDETVQSFSESSEDGGGSDSSREETVYETIGATAGPAHGHVHAHPLVVRVLIPDLQQTKCMRLDLDWTVWTAKQRVLCSLNQSLKDVLNYGLFQPARDGRDVPLQESSLPAAEPGPEADLQDPHQGTERGF
uniref:Talin N-terminal F0 domain-containing protein n=1 Tax=Salarias fasciatus TaxID=181472 RepID=A0A672F7T1_SALFA